MNDQVIDLRLKNLEERCNKSEDAIVELRTRVSNSETTQRVILTQLEYIQEKIDEVASKQDVLLNNHSTNNLTEDKAKKWDKIIMTIIATVITALIGAVMVLILK